MYTSAFVLFGAGGHRGSFMLEVTVNCVAAALHTSLGEDTSVRSICKSGMLGPVLIAIAPQFPGVAEEFPHACPC